MAAYFFLLLKQQLKEDLEELEERTAKRKTYRLWLDCLIKPAYIMVSYVKAECEVTGLYT